MPIQFIFRLASESTITELSGLFSSTLFTLGSTISLDCPLLSLLLLISLETPLDCWLKSPDEAWDE
jgi:hypothetical protein